MSSLSKEKLESGVVIPVPAELANKPIFKELDKIIKL